MQRSPIGKLRQVGFYEAISFLVLLGIACVLAASVDLFTLEVGDTGLRFGTLLDFVREVV